MQTISSGQVLTTNGNYMDKVPNDDDPEDGKRCKGLTCQTYMNTSFFKAMRPLMYNMQLFGMFFPREYAEDVKGPANDPGGKALTKRRRSVSFWEVYAAVILAVYWFNFLRMFSAFNSDDSFGPWLFMKILNIAWMLDCTLNASACFYACQNYDCVPKLFLSWKSLYPEGCARCTEHLSGRVVLYIIVAWFVGLVNIGGAIYGMYFSNMFDVTLAPFSPESPHVHVVKAVYFVVHVYLSMTWALMQAYAYLLCSGFYKQFQTFNDEFRQQIDAKGHFRNDLLLLRMRHQKMVRMIGHADGFLNIYVASSYGTGIVKLCLILYNLLWYDAVLEDTVMLVLTLYWIAQVLFNMTLASIGGALVNHAAHDVYEDIHDMDTSDMDTNQTHQLHMFLNRLSNSTIGLTAGGMFVIDKPTILTIVGMLITYFVLIVQFAPGDVETCDCRHLLANYTESCITAQQNA